MPVRMTAMRRGREIARLRVALHPLLLQAGVIAGRWLHRWRHSQSRARTGESCNGDKRGKANSIHGVSPLLGIPPRKDGNFEGICEFAYPA
jgi:hypothetical protein